jgi:hypothetical protein
MGPRPGEDESAPPTPACACPDVSGRTAPMTVQPPDVRPEDDRPRAPAVAAVQAAIAAPVVERGRPALEAARRRSAAWPRRAAFRIDAPLLDLVFLLGLGGVFLANAAVAVLDPNVFTTLVADSPLGGVVGGAGWVAPIIAGNDFVVGAAVIAAHRFQRLRLPVLAWAGVWLMVVTMLKATTMG